jgi:hypothetical protein
MSEQEPKPKPPSISSSAFYGKADADDRFTAFVDKYVLGYFIPFAMGAAVMTLGILSVTFCSSLAYRIWEERDLATMGLIAMSVLGGLAGLMLKWKWGAK